MARARRRAHPAVAVGQRVLVVLRSPSMAERVALTGGVASEQQGARLDAEALAAQQQLLSELEHAAGSGRGSEFSYSRVLNGFSAPLDPRAIAVLERRPEVAGVYPVRDGLPGVGLVDAARRRGRRARGEQPAGAAAAGLRRPRRDDRAARHRRRPRAPVPARPRPAGDRPRRRRRATRAPRADPDGSNRLERHGTEMAGHPRRRGRAGRRERDRARRLGAADPRRRLAARRRRAARPSTRAPTS